MLTKGEGFLFDIRLTKTEKEVCLHLAKGLSAKEISQIMFIEPKSVKFHVGNIYVKFRVESRAQWMNVWFTNLATCLILTSKQS